MRTICQGLFFYFIVLLVAFVPVRSFAIEIQLYSYHDFPPFVTGEETGLTYELAEFLNQRSDDVYKFQVRILPRKRLDNLLQTDSDIVVPWVSSSWFGKEAKTRYHWTLPLLSDGNVYISHITNPVEITTIDALNGKVVGGILGHRYAGLDELIAAGKVSRMNAPNETSLIQMIGHNRMDVAIIALSAAKFIIREKNLSATIYFSEYNHSFYTRRVLVSGHQPELTQFLDDLSTRIDKDPGWNEKLVKYNLK